MYFLFIIIITAIVAVAHNTIIYTHTSIIIIIYDCAVFFSLSIGPAAIRGG